MIQVIHQSPFNFMHTVRNLDPSCACICIKIKFHRITASLFSEDNYEKLPRSNSSANKEAHLILKSKQLFTQK